MSQTAALPDERKYRRKLLRLQDTLLTGEAGIEEGVKLRAHGLGEPERDHRQAGERDEEQRSQEGHGDPRAPLPALHAPRPAIQVGEERVVERL